MQPSVVIPTFTNSVGLIKLMTQLAKYDGEVIIVDNKPSDEKKVAAKKLLKHGIYLPQAANLGFARGVNEGVNHATSPWLAILNDDLVLPSKDTLSELVSFCEKKKWEAVSPILEKPNGTLENYGYTLLPMGRVALNSDRQKLDSSAIDGITAACLIIKSSVLKEMHGFDESFFAYLEDVDLFLRIKQAGYEFGICLGITVIHEHMTTSGKMGWFKEKQDFVNWFRVIAKNWGWKRILLNLPTIIVERLRNLYGLVKKIVCVVID